MNTPIKTRQAQNHSTSNVNLGHSTVKKLTAKINRISYLAMTISKQAVGIPCIKLVKEVSMSKCLSLIFFLLAQVSFVLTAHAGDPKFYKMDWTSRVVNFTGGQRFSPFYMDGIGKISIEIQGGYTARFTIDKGKCSFDDYGKPVKCKPSVKTYSGQLQVARSTEVSFDGQGTQLYYMEGTNYGIVVAYKVIGESSYEACRFVEFAPGTQKIINAVPLVRGQEIFAYFHE